MNRNSVDSSGTGPPQKVIQKLANLYNQGQFLASIKLAELILKEHPHSIIVWNALGGAYEVLGEFIYAQKAFKKVIELNPNYVDGHYNLGVSLQKQGNIELAIKAYKKSISINENYLKAYVNLGIALKHLGRIEESIEAFTKVLLLKPDYNEAYFNLVPTLKGIHFKKQNSNLQNIISYLLDKKTFARPRDIIDATLSLLKLNTKLGKHLEFHSFNDTKFNPQEVIEDLSKYPLLLKIMSICPLKDIELEKLLKKLRAKLIISINDCIISTELLTFQSALALQCFTNEYIYDQTNDEEKAVLLLEESIALEISNNNQPSPHKILSLASYKPLNEYKWSNSLIINDEIKDVFTRQITEPQREIKIRQSLPLLNKITNEVSSKVRNQYEKSPYPRWVNSRLRFKPILISEMISEYMLNPFDDKIKNVKSPDILVAGCGTGEHSIRTATMYKDSKVLAVDLSASSLSYAKRKTEELNIININYMQADILHLNKLERQFDIVECVGVLHHMDDPNAGWRVLKNCLKPGGLMRIGLYSELARKHIVEMREEILSYGLGSSDVEMKSYRNMLMVSKKSHHKLILNSSDLYSMSSLKDLLFHVQEHRFTIKQIQDCLFNLGLKFCGFETDTIDSYLKFNNNDKDDLYDLNKWKKFEEANPTSFSEMYQFWCQKIA